VVTDLMSQNRKDHLFHTGGALISTYAD